MLVHFVDADRRSRARARQETRVRQLEGSALLRKRKEKDGRAALHRPKYAGRTATPIPQEAQQQPQKQETPSRQAEQFGGGDAIYETSRR